MLQYLGYCRDVGFKPMSRSTLCKVLSVCSASTRRSLLGLDYVSAAGVKTFDELEKVVDKLGDDYGKGFTWAKVQKENLQLAKRYLKGDYKVRVFCECISCSLMKKKNIYQSYLVAPKVDVTRGRFPLNRELRNFRKGGGGGGRGIIRKLFWKVFGNPKIIEFPKRELVNRTFLKFRGIPLHAAHLVYSYLMHFALKRDHVMM